MLSRWPGELAALIAGAAMPLAFAPFDIYPLAVFALAALFATWRTAAPGRAFARGALFGLGMFGAGVNWVFISMHYYGGVGWQLSLALTVLLIGVMAVFPALAGYAAVRLTAGARAARLAPVLIFPAVWTLLEWVRGWFLTGFPWLNIGYSQIDAPLSGLAPVMGVYGVSLAAAVSSALLLDAVAHSAGAMRGRPLAAVAVLWMMAGALAMIGWTRPVDGPLRVSLVQGNIPQDLKWHPRMREPTVELYLELTREHWGSDLIIWPETAMPMFYLQARPYLDVVASAAREHGSELLIGLVYLEPDGRDYFNSMVSVGGDEQFYHKRHLVPFTEYLPMKSVLAGFVDVLDVPMSDFTAGNTAQPPLEVAGAKVGMSICYEDAFGEEVIEALPEATVLVNVSNDAWFGGSVAPHQHLQIARMRALETGRPLLRATNTGVTATVSPRGELRAVAPQFEAHVLTDTVQPMRGATPYVRVGNYAAVVMAVMMIVGGVAAGRGRTKGRSEG